MDIYTKITQGHYRNKLPFAIKKTDRKAFEAYQQESARLDELFRNDALEYCGLTGHPKADKAFAFAWEHGHASGLHDVMGYLTDAAELVKG